MNNNPENNHLYGTRWMKLGHLINQDTSSWSCSI